MSQWTHVCGSIRIDDLGEMPREELVEKLGRVLHYDDDETVWDDARKHPERFTPMGSEGGIEYEIYTNPDKSDTARYVVSIFGDLRDYTDVNAIKEWFENILYDEDLWIRDGTLSIDREFIDKTIISYGEKNSEKEE